MYFVSESLPVITIVKPGSYFLRNTKARLTQRILPANANAIQMLASQIRKEIQLSCEYRSERGVVTSNSHRIRVRRKYEPGFRLVIIVLYMYYVKI